MNEPGRQAPEARVRHADDLTLYVARGCGYCQDVREALHDLKVQVPERDARRDPEARDALEEATGRRTVPVLRIERADGQVEWLPESRDIIRYLYERFGSSAPRQLKWIRLARGLRGAMWVLLLAGIIAEGPWRFSLWAAACSAAGLNAAVVASRTRNALSGLIAAVFGLGTLSLGMQAAGGPVVPWWWAAFALAALLLGGAVAQWARKRRNAR